jgi:hypothetical protein
LLFNTRTADSIEQAQPFYFGALNVPEPWAEMGMSVMFLVAHCNVHTRAIMSVANVNADLVAEYRRQIGDAFSEHWRVSDANAKYKVRAVPNSLVAIHAFAVH